MALFFLDTLKTTLLLSPVLLLLWGLSQLGYKRYRADVRLVLWHGAGVLLLFPFATQKLLVFFFAKTQPLAFFPTNDIAVAEAFAQAAQSVMQGTAVLGNEGNASSAFSYQTFLVLAWTVGVLLVFLVRMIYYFVGRRNLFRWSIEITDTKTKALLEQSKQKLQVKRSIGLWRSDKVSSPLLIGFFNPAIVLPPKNLSVGELEYVFTHELLHYKKLDLWSQFFFLLITCLHWFNPFVWLVERRVDVDRELRCDKAVLTYTGKERKGYSYSILAFANQAVSSAPLNLSTKFIGKKNLKKRIEHIMEQKKQKIGVLSIVAILSLILLLGGCLATSPKEARTSLPVQKENSLKVVGPQATAEMPTVVEDEVEEGELEESGLSLEEYAQENLEEFKEKEVEKQREIGQIYASLQYSKKDFTTATIGWPVPDVYTIDAAYGWRFGGTDFHTGIDIGGEEAKDSPVVSIADGEVTFVNTEYHPGRGYGMFLILDHGDEVTSLYAHLSAISVKVGDTVVKGQTIGTVGDTGFANKPHLHLEIREQQVHVDPMLYYVEEEPLS